MLVGDGGCWSPLGDGAGGRWLPFVGTVGGRSSALVAGAGVCTWVVVVICGWSVAVVRWWPFLLRVVVAGRLWVVGMGALVFVWGQGCYCMVVGGHPLVGVLLLLSIYLPHCWQRCWVGVVIDGGCG